MIAPLKISIAIGGTKIEYNLNIDVKQNNKEVLDLTIDPTKIIEDKGDLL
jgi:hypothetical protein